MQVTGPGEPTQSLPVTHNQWVATLTRNLGIVKVYVCMVAQNAKALIKTKETLFEVINLPLETCVSCSGGK